MCANAVFSAPDAYSRRHIVACVASLIFSESALIDRICYPADWPHLTIVCMSAELKVHTRLLSLLKIIWLMI